MRILGIDPGLATVGIGMIESPGGGICQNPDWQTITSPAHTPLPERLKELHKDLAGILTDFQPELVVIEKLFFQTNVKTAIDVAQARGVLLLTVAQQGIPVLEATPLQLKLGITGDGQADKVQMQTMLVHLLHLSDIPKPDDAADALALAVYGALAQRELSIG